MRKGAFTSKATLLTAFLLLNLLGSSCLPKPPAESGDLNLTVYGFSIMKESLEKSIYPGFAANWKPTTVRRSGSPRHLPARKRSLIKSCKASKQTSLYSPSNAMLSGLKTAVLLLPIGQRYSERHDQQNTLCDSGTSGNPKGIRDFADLAKPGVKVIHPDPVCSGGAQWSVLAIYGSELVKSEKQSGEPDQAAVSVSRAAAARR